MGTNDTQFPENLSTDPFLEKSLLLNEKQEDQVAPNFENGDDDNEPEEFDDEPDELLPSPEEQTLLKQCLLKRSITFRNLKAFNTNEAHSPDTTTPDITQAAEDASKLTKVASETSQADESRQQTTRPNKIKVQDFDNLEIDTSPAKVQMAHDSIKTIAKRLKPRKIPSLSLKTLSKEVQTKEVQAMERFLNSECKDDLNKTKLQILKGSTFSFSLLPKKDHRKLLTLLAKQERHTNKLTTSEKYFLAKHQYKLVRANYDAIFFDDNWNYLEEPITITTFKIILPNFNDIMLNDSETNTIDTLLKQLVHLWLDSIHHTHRLSVSIPDISPYFQKNNEENTQKFAQHLINELTYGGYKNFEDITITCTDPNIQKIYQEIFKSNKSETPLFVTQHSPIAVAEQAEQNGMYPGLVVFMSSNKLFKEYFASETTDPATQYVYRSTSLLTSTFTHNSKSILFDYLWEQIDNQPNADIVDAINRTICAECDPENKLILSYNEALGGVVQFQFTLKKDAMGFTKQLQTIGIQKKDNTPLHIYSYEEGDKHIVSLNTQQFEVFCKEQLKLSPKLSNFSMALKLAVNNRRGNNRYSTLRSKPFPVLPTAGSSTVTTHSEPSSTLSSIQSTRISSPPTAKMAKMPSLSIVLAIVASLGGIGLVGIGVTSLLFLKLLSVMTSIILITVGTTLILSAAIGLFLRHQKTKVNTRRVHGDALGVLIEQTSDLSTMRSLNMNLGSTPIITASSEQMSELPNVVTLDKATFDAQLTTSCEATL